MAKRLMKPTSDVHAVPTLLVSCGDGDKTNNIIAVGWAGTLVSEPPILAIGIRPSRYSYPLIQATGEFVANVPTQEMLPEIDYCGTVSGRKADKFKELGLTPAPASQVSAPLIGECPISAECQVVGHLRIGTHGIFLGEIVALHVDEGILDRKGNIDHHKVRMPLCAVGSYWAMGDLLGPFGSYSRK